jgi:hypothetical protein
LGVLSNTQLALSVSHKPLCDNWLSSGNDIGPTGGIKYAGSQVETSTVNSTLTKVLVMNAEYRSHKQLWQALKPRVDFRLEASGPVAWKGPLPLPVLPKSLDWPLPIVDPATLTHGVRELSSPLSE